MKNSRDSPLGLSPLSNSNRTTDGVSAAQVVIELGSERNRAGTISTLRNGCKPTGLMSTRTR
jgi:hypothetical protein